MGSRRKESVVDKIVRTLTKFVCISIAVIILYDVWAIWIYTKTGAEPSTLTQWVHTTFGTELVACGLIKIVEIYKAKEDKDNGN